MSLILMTNTIFAQRNLVIGYQNSYQDTILSGTSATYDTLLIMNHGKLTIVNSNIIVNHTLIVTDSSYFHVSNSNFTVHGQCVFYGNSQAILKDSLTLNAHIICGANAIVSLDSAYVHSDMSYMGQYEILGFDSGQINIQNSLFNLNEGKYKGDFRNNAGFYQYNNDYISTVGVGMTLAFSNNTWLSVDSCTGGIELLINDTATINLSNSESPILWFGFRNGDTANIDFPATNQAYPPSSDVTNYSFSDALPNVNGVDYSVTIANCETVYWALMLYNGSNVTINNDSILAVGMFYTGVVTDTLSGFINNLYYSQYNPYLSDRNIILNNSMVFAWNFYSADSSNIVISNSIFGEVLTFHDSKVEIINSTCDGWGGYVGSSENSIISAKNSTIKRIYGSTPIILNRDNSYTVFENCIVEGNIVLNQYSKLIHNNTIHTDNITIGQESFFLNVSIDTLVNASINSIVNINGSVYALKGKNNDESITGFKLAYSNLDTMNMTTIVDTSYTPSIINGLIYPWNTAGLVADEYLIWLTVFVNGDSLVTASKKMVLNDYVGIKDNPDRHSLFKIYPNPANQEFFIDFESKEFNNFEIQVIDMNGKIRINEKNKTHFKINHLGFGSYIIKLKMKNEIQKQILIIN